MNEKGVFVTALVDPNTLIFKEGSFTGKTTTELTIFQIPQWILRLNII